jgi:hypothetical protein
VQPFRYTDSATRGAAQHFSFYFKEKWGGGFPGRDDHQNHIFGVNLAKQMSIGALFPRAWALIDIRE